MGAPYVISLLGEGMGVDPDPRMRFDAFDCTTFVETVLALSFAVDLPSAELRLDHIRYQGGELGFCSGDIFRRRNGFLMIQAGYFEDVHKK